MLQPIGAPVAIGLAWVSSVHAQDWPTRSITMVVPFAAGGPVDTNGRILGARLSDIVGQQAAGFQLSLQVLV